MMSEQRPHAALGGAWCNALRRMLAVLLLISLSCVLTACAHPATRLMDTYWKLESLGGQPITRAGDARQPFLLLLSDGRRLRGYVSCNVLTGQFEQSQKTQTLRFNVHPVGHSRCPRQMRLERRYIQALQQTRGERIKQQQLTLVDAQGQPLATLKAPGTH